MNRAEMLARVERREKLWDIIIIGGGASGVGCAVDAASRGYDVLVLEQSDFGKGTSSRSTKLIHGGVRYLEQGNVSLVMEALKERGILRQNAPHLVHDLAFVVPNYDWWEMPFYGVGLKIYDLLAAKYRFGKSKILSKKEILKRLPTIKTEGLRGGVIYYDAQFDDARLLINLARTATGQGATVLNYARVFGLTKNARGFLSAVNFADEESGQVFQARAKSVVNATGAFCDRVREMSDAQAKPLIAPSQGIHLVLRREFLPTEDAIMIPHTTDGRVLFAIPWHGHALVGTTDTPVEKAELEPRALEEEIKFVLETAGKYLRKAPRRKDVLSVFAGIRPLVKNGGGKNTAALSRDHTIQIDAAGLITLTGGKWTTYRRMAEDCVNQAAVLAKLPEKDCVTKDLKIHGFTENAARLGALSIYGADAIEIQKLIEKDKSLSEKLHADLPYTVAEVVWSIRNEAARSVEDVLARRTRALFLNARAAMEIAPNIAEIMARELGKDKNWIEKQIGEFKETAEKYLIR
ncbi:MAG TPA: glycerol-3-phosphate dehydrogenase/oxidase [Pyrinomonadaceae bacterium]|nr:glycerol-3-phosphate dehydrogenase/oxidase [Pyrinomonadaceae bacterium]